MIPTTSSTVNVEQLHPKLRARLEAFFADHRIAGNVSVVSGARTRQDQARLYARFTRGGTLAANPDRTLPGGWKGSWHQVQQDGWAHACDLRILGRRITRDAVATIASDFGLRQTVLRPFEWWHFQWRTAGEVFEAPALSDEGEDDQPVDWAAIEAFLAAIADSVGRNPLRRGSTGIEVVVVQGLLDNAGHEPGRADGKYGRRTARACRQYQIENGLAADSVCGAATYRSLRQV